MVALPTGWRSSCRWAQKKAEMTSIFSRQAGMTASQPAAEVPAMLEGARPGCPLSPSLSWGLGSPSRRNGSQLCCV